MNALPPPSAAAVSERKGFCALCRSRCGTVNVVRDGRLVEVRPDRSHPTGQAICPKGRAGPEIAHSADRLTHPLRRTNPKGSSDPGFVRISWEEALEEIATKLLRIKEEHGAEAVAFGMTSSSSSPISDAADWIQRFIRVFGSPNNALAVELCNWHKDYAHAFTYGVGLPSPDYRNSDLIVLWGHNPANSWLAQAQAIGDARGRGAKVVAIDPRRNGSARDADQWICIRPGSDGALALGIANILIERGAYDSSFLRRWSNGPFLVREDDGRFLRGRDIGDAQNPDSYIAWNRRSARPEQPTSDNADDLALDGVWQVATDAGPIACRPGFDHYARICRPYTPERVAELTFVPQDEIVRLADAFAAAERVSYYGWIGIAQHANATQTDRAVAILHALKGCFDRRGGNLPFAAHPTNPVNPISLLPETQRKKALGLEARPIGPPSLGWISSRDLYTAILDGAPYKVRAYMGFGKNMVVSHPDPVRGRQALTALDFHVHCDLFMNPTAEFADIVLPVNSLWERESLRVGFEITAEAQELIQLRQKIIPPVGESRSDMQIVFDLATRMGMEKDFFGGDIDAALDHQLKPTGVTVAQLRQSPEGIRKPLPRTEQRYRSAGFATDTKRLEVYSELFLRNGYAPVPEFAAPQPTDDAFPFILTTANSGYFCHSQHRNITSLRRKAAEPQVSMNSVVAKSLAVTAGDVVEIETSFGRVQMRVAIDDALHPKVVSAQYGWWEACADLGLPGYSIGQAGANFNAMIGEVALDPISAAPALRSHVCRMRPITQQAWDDYREFRITDRQSETDDVTTIRLGDLHGAALPAIRAGQHISLRLNGITRSYSLIDPPSAAPTSYAVSIKRHENGAFSAFVADRLGVGDVIEAKLPYGNFLPSTTTRFPVVFIAAGIGVTPFIGYLEALKGDPSEPEVVLHYINRSHATAAFADRLAALAARLPHFTCVHHFTRPERNDPPHGRGRAGAEVVTDRQIAARARIYICGPDEMMTTISAALVARGVHPFEIFRERFQAPPPPRVGGDAVHRISFKLSGKTLDWKAGDGTILSCADKAGISLPSGCRVGQCESCALAVVKGEVHHLLELDGAEDGVCLTCQAVPLSDLVLDG